MCSVEGSALSMLAPLGLGLWADLRGEREVYVALLEVAVGIHLRRGLHSEVGISLAAGAAALLFASGPNAFGFAAAWDSRHMLAYEGCAGL